jgi:hypothetical protein
VGGEPVDEAVDVRGLNERRVVVKADRPALVVDADEERPSIGVEESGDRLDDGVLRPLVLGAVAEVPACGRFELDRERLVAGDQLRVRYGEERVLALEPLSDLLGETGVGPYLLEDGARDLIDVELGADAARGGGRGRCDGDGRLGRRALVVDAGPIVVVAGEDVVEDRICLPLPGLGAASRVSAFRRQSRTRRSVMCAISFRATCFTSVRSSSVSSGSGLVSGSKTASSGSLSPSRAVRCSWSDSSRDKRLQPPEHLFDVLVDDLQLRDAVLIEERHCRPVLDRVAEVVGRDLIAEDLACPLHVPGDERRSREAEESWRSVARGACSARASSTGSGAPRR